MTCVPCSIESVQVKAAYFCQTCEKPEPLCETCATQHTRQKLTQDHNMSKDFLKYFKLRLTFGYFAFSSLYCLPCCWKVYLEYNLLFFLNTFHSK